MLFSFSLSCAIGGFTHKPLIACALQKMVSGERYSNPAFCDNRPRLLRDFHGPILSSSLTCLLRINVNDARADMKISTVPFLFRNIRPAPQSKMDDQETKPAGSFKPGSTSVRFFCVHARLAKEQRVFHCCGTVRKPEFRRRCPRMTASSDSCSILCAGNSQKNLDVSFHDGRRLPVPVAFGNVRFTGVIGNAVKTPDELGEQAPHHVFRLTAPTRSNMPLSKKRGISRASPSIARQW
jgi:hypothetical protein